MSTIVRTNSQNKDFQDLVIELDKELKNRDGEDHSFYAQFNKIDQINNVIVFYVEDKAVGCGAFKYFGPDTVEVKRMFVLLEYRKVGIGQEILRALEAWASEINFTQCILETGKKQSEAIMLYGKAGYKIIPNYGQYENVENSVCMLKKLK